MAGRQQNSTACIMPSIIGFTVLAILCLAVTVRELNVGAGLGRLPDFRDVWVSKSVPG